MNVGLLIMKTVGIAVSVVICVIIAHLGVCVEGTLTGRFIHLTDTHLLRAYGVGTDPKKNCVTGTGSAGVFGDWSCDTTWAVQNFTVEALKARPKPDFILYGGDHTALKDPSQSINDTEWYINDIARILREVRNAYGPDVRVFPMLGNHDSFPFYQFPEEGPFYVYEAAAKAWKDFLQPSSLETVRKGGYYTELIEPGLRLVVVNTAMYFDANFAFPEWTVDPGGQLAWMRSVLQKAKDAGELVFLAAHVPPGSSEITWTVDMWLSLNDQFVRALEGFNGNPVVASFFGHTHFATYKIFSNENVTVPDSTNSHVGFISTSLTPRYNANPAFTEYTFMTKRPYTVTDRIYQYIDIGEANKEGSMKWKKAKSYSEMFGSNYLDVETMSNAIDRMHSDPELFQAFFADMRSFGPQSTSCKTDRCRHITLCTMNNLLIDQWNDCYNKYEQ